MLARALNTIHQGARQRPFLFLALVLAAMCLTMLDARALWFSDEVRYANAFQNFLDGHWVVLHLNGEMYPDKPPLYFGLLWLISLFTGGATMPTFMLGAAVSGLFFLGATAWLARSVAGYGRETLLTAGIALLGCFYFVGLTHYSRMDLLFASLILASQALLFLGMRAKPTGFSWLALTGWLASALAVLTKGPLGFALPLAAIVVYLAWSGRLRRLFRLDTLVGLGLVILLVGGWLLGAWLVEGDAYVNNILYKQVYRRALDSWHHEHPFYHYLLTLPLVWLPWTALLACLPLKRLRDGGFWRGLWASRKNAGGPAFLWCSLLSGFVLLSSVHTKIVIYALPLFAPLAILTARGVLSLEGERRKRFWTIVTGYFLLLALLVPLFEIFTPWPIPVGGTGLVLLCLAGTGALVRYASRLGTGPALAAMAIGMVVTLQPIGLITLPSLNPAMSPKATAEVMKDYVERGYEPAAHNTYAGIYTYYLGREYMETQDLEKIGQFVEDNGKAVVAFKKKYWQRWEDKPADMRVVFEQWIVDRPYVVAVTTEE
ncbi:ArnT family glycosyltransferase [Desulfohalovibrio reitneri]|uniref:ArnT family glycosyltransferase n=1 Tax=Desulfohalovibrio reitneri TaxID=1307759 RepID=UPI0005587592|nr:dolichyl-phosphate-mannose-mannosyltransferase [Desulfohalovibrio reitneri]